jgi:hypothetical protein
VTLAAGGVVTTQETERSFYAGVTDELVETSLTREADAATVSVATEYASVAGAAAAMRRKVETQASAGLPTHAEFLELAALMFPVHFHVPLLRYHFSWFRCPSCGKRTWLRVHLDR